MSQNKCTQCAGDGIEVCDVSAYKSKCRKCDGYGMEPLDPGPVETRQHWQIVQELTKERDDARAERARLQRWKDEMMTVDKWWDRIDAAVRKRADITVGTSVADAALRLIEERDELKEFIHCLP